MTYERNHLNHDLIFLIIFWSKKIIKFQWLQFPS